MVLAKDNSVIKILIQHTIIKIGSLSSRWHPGMNILLGQFDDKHHFNIYFVQFARFINCHPRRHNIDMIFANTDSNTILEESVAPRIVASIRTRGCNDIHTWYVHPSINGLSINRCRFDILLQVLRDISRW